MGDFERDFGGLERTSEASYGIRQFFLNGGSQAWGEFWPLGKPDHFTIEG